VIFYLMTYTNRYLWRTGHDQNVESPDVDVRSTHSTGFICDRPTNQNQNRSEPPVAVQFSVHGVQASRSRSTCHLVEGTGITKLNLVHDLLQRWLKLVVHFNLPYTVYTLFSIAAQSCTIIMLR